jgi:uncharacterized membrane protein YkvA (DUF1232 family)
MRVSFDLSENDLKYFRRVMRDVRDKAKGSSEDEIVSAARELLTTIAESDVPEFIEVRIGKLGRLIDMLEDEEWALSGKDRERVVRGMAYFAEPDDIIPDKVPVLGFLDDAIMVELVVSELEHELTAYEDFCKFRETREARFGEDEDPTTREEWVIARRQALQARMRRRRSRRRSHGRSRGKTPLSLF